MPWSQKIVSLEEFIANQAVDASWTNSDVLRTNIQEIAQNLDQNVEDFQKETDFIQKNALTDHSYVDHVADLFRRWHLQSCAPSISAMIVGAMEYFNLGQDEILTRAMLVAGVLGDVENDLPYHNNMHFRKVLMHTIALIATHNKIFDGTAKCLEKREIALLLIAAALHDLGHDGKSNAVDGVHHMGRMERRSYELAIPFVEKAGLEERDLYALSMMLLTTDVSPMGYDRSANKQMRRIYQFHQGGKEPYEIHDDIAHLCRNERLTLMCLLLHEADIATSAGISYDVTKFETSQIARELGKDVAEPHMVIEFLDDVCQRKMLSDAAQKLFAASMARVYILASEDVENGDHPYPPPEHSNFILNIDSQDDKSANRTIN